MCPRLQGADAPIAIFCTGDHYAHVILIVLNNPSMRVPTAISVASFDDIHLASMLIPSLTTVHVYHQAMGKDRRRAFAGAPERRRYAASTHPGRHTTHGTECNRPSAH